jgi:23S rRNA pseudouridine1911/1915/1917 synthase
MRLDHALAMHLGISRSRVQEMVRRGLVELDGRPAEKDHRVTGKEEVSVLPLPQEEAVLKPAPIPLRIVYQDGDIAVVSKQPGLVVHPAAGHPDDTLVNALLHALPDVGFMGGEVRPGIVHRLDRDTSGLMVVAKNEKAMQRLQEMVRRREVKREYLALVHGSLPGTSGTIDAPVGRNPRDRKKMAVTEGGRRAVTHYRVRETIGAFTLVEAELETGRTHQIRVHFSHIGHPVAGDGVYGRGARDRRELGLERQFLHAWRLSFPHPSGEGEIGLEDPLPADLQEALERLRERR